MPKIAGHVCAIDLWPQAPVLVMGIAFYIRHISIQGYYISAKIQTQENLKTT